jgi:hypothetical protein
MGPQYYVASIGQREMMSRSDEWPMVGHFNRTLRLCMSVSLTKNKIRRDIDELEVHIRAS